jgi:hypothetical protein
MQSRVYDVPEANGDVGFDSYRLGLGAGEGDTDGEADGDGDADGESDGDGDGDADGLSRTGPLQSG